MTNTPGSPDADDEDDGPLLSPGYRFLRPDELPDELIDELLSTPAKRAELEALAVEEGVAGGIAAMSREAFRAFVAGRFEVPLTPEERAALGSDDGFGPGARAARPEEVADETIDALLGDLKARAAMEAAMGAPIETASRERLREVAAQFAVVTPQSGPHEIAYEGDVPAEIEAADIEDAALERLLDSAPHLSAASRILIDEGRPADVGALSVNEQRSVFAAVFNETARAAHARALTVEDARALLSLRTLEGRARTIMQSNDLVGDPVDLDDANALNVVRVMIMLGDVRYVRAH